MSFLNIMLCYYFSLELTIALPKNKLMQNSGDIEAWASVKTQSLLLQITKTDLNYKLQLLAPEYQQQSPRGAL